MAAAAVGCFVLWSAFCRSSYFGQHVNRRNLRSRDQQCQWQTGDLLQSPAADPDLVVWRLPSMLMFLSHVLVSNLVTGGKLHSSPPGKMSCYAHSDWQCWVWTCQALVTAAVLRSHCANTFQRGQNLLAFQLARRHRQA